MGRAQSIAPLRAMNVSHEREHKREREHEREHKRERIQPGWGFCGVKT